MNNQQSAHRVRNWAGGASLLALLFVGCSGGDLASPSAAGGASSSAGAIDTQIEGEHFSSLSAAADKVSGVFVKGDQSLAFEVDQQNGGSAYRLSTVSGEVLYSIVKSPTAVEMRVGSSYRSSLPIDDAKGVAPSPGPAYSPAGFEATGDLHAALNGLKSTPFALLPYLAAALGRVGLDGASAPITLTVHLSAERFSEELGLELDPTVLATTNRIIAARAPAPSTPATTVDSPPKDTPGELRTEGLTPPLSCPLGRPPCRPGTSVATIGLLAGCCVPPTPAPAPVSTADYSQTASCSSGVAREVFPYLDYNPTDPCRDQCLGMCGPGCSPWLWVCQDEAVHAACWNHDSAYCPSSINLGWFSIPNPEWPVCETEYGVYSLQIGVTTAGAGLCQNNAFTDWATTPPFGLSTNVPGFFVKYKN